MSDPQVPGYTGIANTEAAFGQVAQSPGNQDQYTLTPVPVGGGGTILQLSYAATGPFPVPVFGIPTGWTSGIAALGAQLTVATSIGTGLLLGFDSNPIPDGFTFPATIFVEGTTIYDIIAVNPWLGTTNGGLLYWNDEGGVPNAGVYLGASGISLQTSGGLNIFLPDLPTSDPAAVGALWANMGVVTVSAG